MADSSFDMSDFLKRMQQLDTEQRRKAQHAVDEFGEHVLGVAKEGTPYDTGALQKSATAEKATWSSAGNLVKRIGFGVRYAAAVHELWQATKRIVTVIVTTRADGKKSRRTDGRGNRNEKARAKFLELALREQAAKFGDFLARRLRL